MADEYQLKFQSFQQKKKELEKQMKQVSIPCPHQFPDKKKSALKIQPGTQNVKCKRCQEEFSMRKITPKELLSAVSVIHDAINQIKICCDPASEKDQELINNLGKQDFYNLDIVEVYDRVTNDYGNDKNKNKKKKKDRQSSVGYYGSINY